MSGQAHGSRIANLLSCCAVSPEQLRGEGAVVCLAAYEGGSKPREAVLLLVVQEDSGAVVWDAR
jgi:hypothetical protein